MNPVCTFTLTAINGGNKIKSTLWVSRGLLDLSALGHGQMLLRWGSERSFQMTVESNCAIATLGDWLEKPLSHVSFPTNEKQNQN